MPKNPEAVFPPGLKRPLFFYIHKGFVSFGDPIRLFTYLKKTFGNAAHYTLFGTDIVFLNDPELIREVLINQSSAFGKERTLQRMKILLGEGLITSDDPIHMRQRRIAAPAFHRQRIAQYAQMMVDRTTHITAQWHDGQTIDINAEMMRLSLEIVARTLFATEVTADVAAINNEVNTIMALYHYLIAFPNLEAVLHLPIPGIIKFRRSRARLNAVVNRLIAEHRNAPPDSPAANDLLSLLMASVDEEADATGAHTGMSNEQLRDEVLTIFLAGYETVANALTWTWYLLSQNPDAEAKMHAELDAVLATTFQGRHPERSEGSPQPPTSLDTSPLSNQPVDAPPPARPRPPSRLPTLADYPNLKYTEMVFAESMRLYPPAWAMGRVTNRTVQIGPYTFPKNTNVFFSQYIMHRSPEQFPNPLHFDPERHTPENKAGRPKFAYFPFGGGNRQCIGEGFAWMEGVLALATIASRFRMEYLDPAPPVPEAKITLRPKHPMHMKLHAR